MDVVLNAGELAYFTLNDNAVSVGIVNDLLCESDILFKGIFGSVNHNGGKTAVDARLADFKVCAVIKMESEVNAGVLNGCLCKSHKVCGLCIFSRACRYLKDNGGFFFSRRLCDGLNYLHIVDVERADSISAGISLFEHFFCCYKCHL